MTNRRLRRLAAAATLAGTLVVAGCGTDLTAQNLCANAKSLATAVDGLKAQKPDGSKVAELTTKVDAALAKLDHLQAVTEGRYDSAISTLRANLEGFKQTLAAAGKGAFTTVAPELTASLKDISAAYAQLSQSIAAQCASG
ncbi:hypothetical protein [Intrasporangium sp. YIM S08009]|uniref:hypothetical protein n=1 Tax=Intrasporangium zincisolvens TaxID=3080018 RepID=UPI002B05796F|nr:hypothetical protein [Intrasporangium sp. YIM S08009]